MVRAESTGASGRIDHGSGSIHALLDRGLSQAGFPVLPIPIREPESKVNRPELPNSGRLPPISTGRDRIPPEIGESPNSARNGPFPAFDHGFRRVLTMVRAV